MAIREGLKKEKSHFTSSGGSEVAIFHFRNPIEIMWMFNGHNHAFENLKHQKWIAINHWQFDDFQSSELYSRFFLVWYCALSTINFFFSHKRNGCWNFLEKYYREMLLLNLIILTNILEARIRIRFLSYSINSWLKIEIIH